MPVNTCKVCGKQFKCHSWNTATCDDCLEAGFKYCTSCGTVKPVSEFHFRKGKPYICNTCHYAKCRKSNKSTNYQAKLNERYRTDEEYRKKQIEASMASYNKRLEQDAEYMESRNKACRERRYERYHTDDDYRDKTRKYKCEYEYNRYHTDEEYKERIKIRTSDRARRVRGNFTVAQWHEACAAFNCTCAYCGAKADLTMDHVVPVSQGGETTVGNIIPACRSCNSSKGAKDMIEWYTAQPFYDKARLENIIKYLRSREVML